MKTKIILIGIYLLGLLHQNLYSQIDSAGDDKNYIDGNIDHVVITLRTKQYHLIDSLLRVHFNNCWYPQVGKGFIFSASRRPYVELWDAGSFFQYGHQVAFSSNDEDAKEKAKKYYGNNGLDFQGALFTVGKEGQAGHPIGGTFYVEYANTGIIPANDTMRIKKFIGLITTIPATRKNIIQDYKFFNFTITKSDSINFIVDKNGFTVQLIELPIENIVFGHLALQFRLRDSISERKEYILSNSVKAIIDGNELTLVFNSYLYDTFISRK